MTQTNTYRLKLADARIAHILSSMSEGMEEVARDNGEKGRELALRRVGMLIDRELERALDGAACMGPIVLVFQDMSDDDGSALEDIVDNTMDNTESLHGNREEDDPNYETDVYFGDAVLSADIPPLSVLDYLNSALARYATEQNIAISLPIDHPGHAGLLKSYTFAQANFLRTWERLFVLAGGTIAGSR